MVDFAAARSQAKGVAPAKNRERGQWPTFARASRTVAAVAMRLNPLPPPSTYGVDRLYRQLAEMHAITTAQLAECIHWRRVHSTSSPVHIRASSQKPVAVPSATRMTSPPTGLST
jgi:hypothetical protein